MQTINEHIELWNLHQELKEKVQAWWDDVYPADLFTGVSGDEGAERVAEIRNVFDKINDTEKRRSDVCLIQIILRC